MRGVDAACLPEREDRLELCAQASQSYPTAGRGVTPLTVRLWFISCSGVSSGDAQGSLRGEPGRVAALPAGQVGEPERDQPAARAQQFEPLPPVIAAERVQHHVHALAAGQPAGPRPRNRRCGSRWDALQPSARSTSCLAAEAVPKTTSSSTVRHSWSTAVPTPPAAICTSTPLVRTDVGDAEQQVVGGEVVDRDRRGLLEARAVRDLGHLLRGHAHHVRVTPETRHGQHALACRGGPSLHARVDHAGHLIADHARRLRERRDTAPARPSRPRSTARPRGHGSRTWPGAGLGIGRLPQLQGAGPARPGDPDRSHGPYPPRGTPRRRVMPSRPGTL